MSIGTETLTGCPFVEQPFMRPNSERPQGLQTGKAAHAIVKLGAPDARKALGIDWLESRISEANPDPTKGWRNALAAIAIDASYRNAFPEINSELRRITSGLQNEPLDPYHIGKIIVGETEQIFSVELDKLFTQSQLAPIAPNTWISEVLRELERCKTTQRNIADYPRDLLKKGASTIFSEYSFVLGYLVRTCSDPRDIPDILRNSYSSFILPLTKTHLEDSYDIGQEIHSKYELQQIGINDHHVVLNPNRISHHPLVHNQIRAMQEITSLNSVITGCPGLLSPKVTQSRYSDSSLPPYSSTLQGLYFQMTDFIEQGFKWKKML